MDKQEIKAQVKDVINRNAWHWSNTSLEVQAVGTKIVADQILAIYKGKCEICAAQHIAEIALTIKEALPELAKAAGYVRLSPDQNLPEIPHHTCESPLDFGLGMDFLVNKGWRRVEVE